MATYVNHFALTVSDIGKSVEFYKNFGLFAVEDEPVDVTGAFIEQMTSFPDTHIKVQHLELGEVMVELLEYQKPLGRHLAKMKTNDIGSAHIAVGVDDIDAEVERLKKDGVVFRSDIITIPDDFHVKSWRGLRAIYAEDPDGYTVELVAEAEGHRAGSH